MDDKTHYPHPLTVRWHPAAAGFIVGWPWDQNNRDTWIPYGRITDFIRTHRVAEANGVNFHTRDGRVRRPADGFEAWASDIKQGLPDNVECMVSDPWWEARLYGAVGRWQDHRDWDLFIADLQALNDQCDLDEPAEVRLTVQRWYQYLLTTKIER